MDQGVGNARRSDGLRRATLALALGLTSACGSDDKIQLEVYSWWERTSEAEAFDQVRLLHQELHPEVVVTNRADPDAGDQRERMASRVLSQAPPATFTANIGADLLRWATIDQEGEGSQFPDRAYVKDVSDLLERTGLLAELPPELTEMLSVGGSRELYGVPINIHRLNVLYYNTTRMGELLKERPDLLTIDALCPPSGRPDLPEGLRIAIGSEPFALFLLTFESLLPAFAGPDFYDALFRGESPASATMPGESYLTDVRRALSCTHWLSKHFVGTNPSWSDMLDSIIQKDGATFTVMGDWANGQLVDELQTGSVTAIPFPGTEKTFVYTSDTFPLPIGVDFEPEVVSLLETIASPAAQRLFSSKKGSIPARRDVTVVGKLKDLAAATREDFYDETVIKVLATSGRFPPYYRQTELGESLRKMTEINADSSTINQALIEFDSQLPLFKKFQERFQTGPARPLR